MALGDQELPVLKGWINLVEAAERLKMSKQYAYKIADEGYFKTLHRVGTKRVFVVKESEVEKKLKERDAAHEDEKSLVAS